MFGGLRGKAHTEAARRRKGNVDEANHGGKGRTSVLVRQYELLLLGIVLLPFPSERRCWGPAEDSELCLNCIGAAIGQGCSRRVLHGVYGEAQTLLSLRGSK